MKILFLDDNKERHAAYRRMSIGDDVDYAFTAKQAVSFLKTAETPYDVASLDHDLDEYATMGQTPRDLTGQYVAKYISKMPPEKLPKKIIIHSFNNAGSLAMMNILREAGIRSSWRMFRVNDRNLD